MIAAPFAVRTAGTIDRRPWHSTPGTKEGDVMLTAFTAGRGIYRLHGQHRIIVAGSVGLVLPEHPGLLIADPDDPYCHHYCRFTGPYAVALARHIVADRGGPFFAEPRCPAIAERINRMGQRQLAQAPRHMGRAECLLAEILTDLAGLGEEESPPFTAASLDAWLRQHVDQPCDLGRIAAHFRISIPTLTRRARQWLGTSLQRRHEDIRMAWATTLLTATSSAIREVAHRVGYQDPAYFARVFTRRMGCSPRRYRDLRA